MPSFAPLAMVYAELCIAHEHLIICDPERYFLGGESTFGATNLLLLGNWVIA